jgi:hypothetical protein
MWEAGSTGFHRADDYSDLDIGILSRAGSNEKVWAIVDQAFDDLGGLALRWSEPNPLFEGMDKRVFRPLKATRWLQVDIGMFPESASELYNQPERHGTISVIFDRSERLQPPPWDEPSHRRHMQEALHQNLMKWRIYHGQFRKEFARGRTVDAFACHLFFTLQPLLAVLGMRYRPHRWDFGYRYLKEELPSNVVEVIERLCYVQSPGSLEDRFAEADALFTKTVRELEAQGITPLDPNSVDISPPELPSAI